MLRRNHPHLFKPDNGAHLYIQGIQFRPDQLIEDLECAIVARLVSRISWRVTLSCWSCHRDFSGGLKVGIDYVEETTKVTRRTGRFVFCK